MTYDHWHSKSSYLLTRWFNPNFVHFDLTEIREPVPSENNGEYQNTHRYPIETCILKVIVATINNGEPKHTIQTRQK